MTRTSNESGMTLIELLLVTIILPVIVGAVGLAIYSAFSVQKSVGASVSSSGGLQAMSSVFYKDVQSAMKMTTDANPSIQCGSGTQLLGLEWDNIGGSYSNLVSYSLQSSGSTSNLVRNYCNFGPSTTPTSAMVISGDVPPQQSPPIITPSYFNTTASSGWVSTNGVTNIDFKIHEVGGSFVYSLDSSPQLSSSSVVASAPGAPTNISAVASPGSATVSWTPSLSTGGSAITGYMVIATDVTNPANGGQECSATSTSCVVSGLDNGDTYTFTVVAINGAGSSNASTSSSPVEPIGPPPAPTGSTASVGNSQSTVSWIASASNGGSAITGYTARSSAGQTCTTTGALTCTVTGLTNGTSYTFTVTATNSAGTSPASAPSNAVTPIGPPSAPSGVTAAATGVAQQATVTWTAPSSNGGATITGYTVTSSAGQICTSTSTSCTVTGLTNGTSYTFTVTATNSAGIGPASAASNAVTPISVLSFRYTGSSQSWTVPSGVTSIGVTLYGAQGGNSNNGYSGGRGGEVTGTLTVSPGEVLTIITAGAGSSPNGAVGSIDCSGATVMYGYGGYGGGGTGGYAMGNAYCYVGGGGGGASQIMNGSTYLAIAAGGGGGGYMTSTSGDSNGGGLNGDFTYNGSTVDGGGAYQSSGGTSGDGGGSGGSMYGGNGNTFGGGGGGGYFGGSGGYYDGGGGGSSLIPSGGSTSSGANSGNGYVSITYQ